MKKFKFGCRLFLMITIVALVANPAFSAVVSNQSSITANEDEEAYNLAMEAGAKGFFLKPFDGQTLINAIDLVLKHRTVELQS